MALFPQGLTNVDQRCNRGERRVLHQLKRCLGDDHLVWHNVPIGRGLLRLARGRRGAGFPRAVPRAPVPLRDDLEESVDPGDFAARLRGMFTVSYPTP